jgi:hypothetical protein
MSNPRVTDILREAGLIDATWYTTQGRDLGTAVHAASAYLDEGRLDWSTVDPLVAPRLRSYQKFLEEMRPAIVSIEETVANPTLGYIGHVDRTLEINGRFGVLDLKSPARAPWHPIQLALYAGCYRGPVARWNLYLSDTNYQLVEHRGRRDWEVAKAAITLASWRRNCAA